MGFQLVISEGKEAGREFEFDQDSVVIGRTAECDVILYEAGVSRKHAKVTVEAGSIFIEDLGSSNGTLVNGDKIAGKHALKDGDLISMGPVIFSFKPVDLEPTAPGAEEGEDGGAHTRVVSLSELKKSRNKAVAMLPKDASREQVDDMGRRATSMLPALKGPRPSMGGNKRVSSPGMAKAPPARLADREEDLPAGVEVAGGGRPRLARVSGERPALSAAEKARYKRGGPLGKAQLWWAEANQVQRIVASIVSGVLTLSLIGGVAYAAWPEGAKPKPPEPEILTGEPVEASFGVGPDVTYERVDSKSFDFEVKSPVQVMVVLHYQAKDISSKDEVNITVNGVELSWLPPDTLDSNERTLEVLVPANLVKRGEINTVTFDNVKNPPETDAWKIWNLWIEVAVLPEKDEAGLIAEAEQKFKRGTLKWEQRDIGASNRWDAYKNFREAWLTLEAMPASARPYTYQLARDRMLEAKRSLDEKCNELLLKSKSAFQFGRYDEARYELGHVKEFFPSRSHPCQARADYEWAVMEL
jgi:hypothetical protein